MTKKLAINSFNAILVVCVLSTPVLSSTKTKLKLEKVAQCESLGDAKKAKVDQLRDLKSCARKQAIELIKMACQNSGGVIIGDIDASSAWGDCSSADLNKISCGARASAECVQGQYETDPADLSEY